jgi:hypothetical protein
VLLQLAQLLASGTGKTIETQKLHKQASKQCFHIDS